eukprot:GSMAST32.ASY1.ANO1.651.1 assembled CDS
MANKASPLAEQHCQKCATRGGDVKELSSAELSSFLQTHPLWKHSDNNSPVIKRSFVARNFKSAMSAINAFAEIAETEQHHPDISLTSYRTVTISLQTHSLKSLSINDIILAAKFDKVNVDYSPKFLREQQHFLNQLDTAKKAKICEKSKEKNVAFIGLGAMGYSMASHLEKHVMLVYNRTKEIAEQHAAEFGTTVMTSLEDLSSVDVCVLCLPTSVIVKDICTKIGAILKSGALVIDATSGDPTLSVQIAKDLSQYGIDYVDCPVSGGPSGAAQGSLTSMIGGQKNPSQRALEFVSSTFSKEGKVVVVGPIGSAHSVKAINNCLNATHLIVACEGLLALKSSGISPATALSVINNSSGRSLQTEKRIPETVLTRNFNYGFSIAH